MHPSFNFSSYSFFLCKSIFVLSVLSFVLFSRDSLTSYEQKYVLSVGRQDEERLEILNEVFNPPTLNLLQSSGLSKGMHVLDVGCGTGIVSCEIAKLVGSEGKVVCVDISQEQLNLAKARAEKEGVSNIEFILLSASDLEKISKKFDAVYCRFLLMHLKDPSQVIDQFLSVLKPGGYLFLVEGMGVNTFDCLPRRCKAFEEYYNLAEKRYLMQQSDSAIGRFLPKMLLERGMELIRLELVHPVLTTRRQKSLLRLGVESFAAGHEDAFGIDYQLLGENLYNHVEKRNDVQLLYIEVNLIAAQKQHRS